MTACSSPPPKGTRSKLCFELSTGSKGAGTISVKGTSGVELARGVAHYFRTRCNSSFAWPRTGGNQITLPVNKTTGETSFPAVDGIETRQVKHLSVRACVRARWRVTYCTPGLSAGTQAMPLHPSPMAVVVCWSVTYESYHSDLKF